LAEALPTAALSKKWIVSSLFADGRLRSMAREYQGIVRQDKDFLANALNQQLMITPWEICPAYAPGEKNVTVEEDVVWRRVKAKASRTVARNKKNAKINAAKIGGRCLLDQKIRLHGFWLQKEPHVFEKVWIGDERNTIFVKSDLALACSLDFGCIIEMIGVTVREHQQIESDSQVPDPIRGPCRSINQKISFRGADQESVGIENTASKSLKVEHSK
jgi:hypothetical protein